MKSETYTSFFEPGKLGKESRIALSSDVAAAMSEDAYDAAAFFRSKAMLCSRAKEDVDPNEEDLRLSVCYSLFADFVEQGWKLSTDGTRISVAQPKLDEFDGETETQVKQRLRKSFEAISNRQLSDPGNAAFIERMETSRAYDGRTVSILDVIDDGEDLAGRLRRLDLGPDNCDLHGLEQVIRPEVVECGGDDKCPFTGYRLQDIWRYFRHTWSLEYKLLPGRTLRLLVRNAARPNHPIVGIALISSPTANLLSRDKWIGWTIDGIISGLMNREYDAGTVALRLLGSIKRAIKEIRTDDLLPKKALIQPKQEHFFELEQLAHRATVARASDLSLNDSGSLVDIRSLNKEQITDEGWKKLSETSLYKKKRAEQLIPLLKALRTMNRFEFGTEPGAALYEALMDSEGRAAIQTALGEIKTVHLASEVADLSVCGAIPPYNHLIGGKLVAALMVSDRVREIYRKRYSKQVSEIASQVKGKRVVRSAELKLLTTTALYGVGSNQYSSLILRADRFPELRTDLVWRKIDSSEGFTVTHISDVTVQLMRALSGMVYGRKRINSVFGEGSSPRTRQIREGLNLIGVNNDELLRQANRKKVYVSEYFQDARLSLLGFGNEMEGSHDFPSNSTEAILTAWAQRWLVPRLREGNDLESLSRFRKSEVPDSFRRRSEIDANLRAD
jgi:hypothetical protein